MLFNLLQMFVQQNSRHYDNVQHTCHQCTKVPLIVNSIDAISSLRSLKCLCIQMLLVYTCINRTRHTVALYGNRLHCKYPQLLLHAMMFQGYMSDGKAFKDGKYLLRSQSIHWCLENLQRKVNERELASAVQPWNVRQHLSLRTTILISLCVGLSMGKISKPFSYTSIGIYRVQRR